MQAVTLHRQKGERNMELLTIAEMAVFFKTTKNAIYARIRRTKQGRDTFPLPISGLGKKHLWLRDDVVRHVQNCESSPVVKTISTTKPKSDSTLARHGIVRKGKGGEV